jgi:hypothetical protein
VTYVVMAIGLFGVAMLAGIATAAFTAYCFDLLDQRRKKR